MAVSDYSTTPGDNTSISGIAVSDSTVIDTVDNIVRQLMADTKAFYDSVPSASGNLTITGNWDFDGGVDLSGATLTLAAGEIATADIADDAVTAAKIADNAVDTAQIADDAVGADQLANTTVTAGDYTAADITIDAQGRITAASDGSAGGTLSSSQATTSGATHDITGLPSGINSIDVILHRVSLDGTDSLLIQLGDSGGFETTGYVSHSNTFTTGVSGASSTAGFIIRVAQAAATISGTLRLRRQTGNVWVADGNLRTGTDGSNFTVNSAGEKTLSAELTQIRLTHNGSNSFDGGAYSILYS